ncbi:MAG: DUF308 domain-containing protein [Bacteroidales bacterium]|nr:DUF308 domain-containing protein [Lachnoclostridium sp.]MCM1384868.1 DUF308 domain-containing protein [Lachnoclostridium sp.]MCM1465783.1 DUF308 domain-containing protein [Bacteroidales bacterium]
MMKALKELKWDALLKGALYILLGVVAFLIPETMERTLAYLIAGVLILAGAVSMICYLLRDAKENYYRNDFLYGLMGIALGIIVLYEMELMISLVPVILGIMVLVSGCAKLQDVIDIKRLNSGNWIALLVIAVIDIIFGILLIANPFKAASILFRLIGAGLIFSGITDCAVIFYFAGQFKRFIEDTADIESSCEEVK